MTGDLTTLPNVKSQIGKTGNDNDEDLKRLITACSTFVKSWLNRDILQAAYVEKRTGSGTNSIVPKNFPIASIASLVIDGIAIPAAASSTAYGYTFDDDAIYLNGCRFTRNKNNILISYTAGYTTCPADLEQAVIETVGMRFKEKGDRIGMVSKGMAGETTAFKIDAFSPSAQIILQQYKKVVPT